MAHDSRGRFCKEEAPRTHSHPSSSVLSAALTETVRFHGDEEEPSQCAAPVRLSRRSMEEACFSSAQGRKPYTRARAKLANSSYTRHGEAGFFSSTRRKKQSTCIEVSADSSSNDPGRRVVLVNLISSSDDSGNNSIDDSGNNFSDNSSNNSGDDSEDHETSSETIMHEIFPWTFTSSLINCSNASISICCRKLLQMTLVGFGLKSTSSRNRLERSKQVLKPVRATTVMKLASI
jgi:hypothetical protein